MPFIPCPNTVQLELIYSQAGQTTQNVHHYLTPVVPSAASLSLFCASALDWWDTQLENRVCSATQLVLIRATDLSSQVGPVVNYGVSLPQVGTRTGTMLPNNVTVAITKRTAARGRSFRGRTYWPGLNTVDVTANVVSGTLIASIITALTAGQTLTTADGDYLMSVLSRYGSGDPRPAGILSTITGFTSDGVVDSQRKRLPGRGS